MSATTTAAVRSLPTDPARPARGAGPVQWALPLTDGSLAVALDAPTSRPSPQTRPARGHLSVVPPPDRTLELRAGRFVQAVVEVAAGTRPLQQLVRVLSTDVYEELQHRLALLSRTRSRTPRSLSAGRVASLRLYQPREDAAEVTARVAHDGRSRAVAARLELDTDRKDPAWVCTALCWV